MIPVHANAALAAAFVRSRDAGALDSAYRERSDITNPWVIVALVAIGAVGYFVVR